MANLVRIGGNAKARSLPILILAICFAAVGGAPAQTSQKPASQEPAQKSVRPKTVEPKPNEPPGVLIQLNGALESLAAKVSPAVVQILVTGYGPLREEDRSQTAFIVRQHAVGSGVIVDSNGYIMTNAHVVEGAQRIRVALPLPTRIVMGLSAFVGQFWWFFIIGVAGIIFGMKQIRKNPRGRYYFDYTLLKLPILGVLLRKIAVARFTRTLGTLITSGVPILEGLSITAKTSGNAVLEEALMKVRKAIEEGRTIVDPLRESGVFPNMVTQMIGVGEATGAMDAMLQKIADFYEDEVDSATKDMLAMLEPVIIGLLGVMIGGIVISLYMPLFSMIAKLAG